MAENIAPAGGVHVLFGTYTEKLPHVDGKAEGILASTLRDGVLGPVRLAAKLRCPSFLTANRAADRIYAVSETREFGGMPGGAVTAFARDRSSGNLTELNQKSSQGVQPCHLALDPDERFLLAANYQTGSVIVFALADDGSLGAQTDLVEHRGSGADPYSQASPHPHMIAFDPVTGEVLVPDLGMDAVVTYRLSDTGTLTESRAHIAVAPGSGPRHLAFHPNGDDFFLVYELDSSLAWLRRGHDGFAIAAVLSTLPENAPRPTPGNGPAAVRVSRSGRHVYVSNRGPTSDNVAIFSFDAPSGELRLVATETTRGKAPRDIVQSPDGSHLLVANQDSDTVVTLEIDEDSSTLRHTSASSAPTPVCILFLD